MDKQDCLKGLEDIEATFSQLIDTRLAGFSDEDRLIATQIINDTVDLIKDLDRDMYMFYVSYENYNNGVSFMPQYYFENILLHDDMVWERIIIIIAIAYQIDIQLIFEKKGIGPLYGIVKKDNRIDAGIKRLLTEINADSNMKALKITRNGNEHYISIHLAKNDKIKTKFEDTIHIENGKLHGDIEKINKQTDYINREEMKLLKEKIVIVSKKQKKYIELLKLCIIQMEVSFKNSTFTFNQKKYFLPNYDKELYIDKEIFNRCEELEGNYSALREDFRIVIDMINESVFAALNKGSMIRNTLLIDSLFRAKEIIRSINLYLGCTCFYIHGEKQFAPTQKETFEKYCCNDVIFSYYYYDHAILKLYSVYEKLAKFLLCKYDFNQVYLDDDKFKGMYIDRVIELFSKRGVTSEILIEFYNCVSSIKYKEYEKIRNRDYHCLRMFYVLDEKSRDLVILDNICNIANMMSSLYKVYSIIIKEEKNIYTKMISDMNE